jgi:hypothetical protein
MCVNVTLEVEMVVEGKHWGVWGVAGSGGLRSCKLHGGLGGCWGQCSLDRMGNAGPGGVPSQV